jgi:hypothetical protein
MTRTPWKTYDEHLDYMHRMVRLSLWFLWTWQRRRPEEPFANILRGRTLIYRYCEVHAEPYNYPADRFDDPRWKAVEEGLADLMRRHAGHEDAAGFERDGLELLRQTIRGRSVIDCNEVPYTARFQFGSVRYDPPRNTAPPVRVFFHIANALAPRSLFDDPAHLPCGLLDLMADARAKHGAEELATGTWLNSVPRWQELFPLEYMEHMTPEDADIRAHMGFWGQFLNARGLFNDQRGDYFRRTGRMRYWPRSSWCRFDSLEAHLRELLRRRGA